jgi:DNA-binding SARP family transcriptional activator
MRHYSEKQASTINGSFAQERIQWHTITQLIADGEQQQAIALLQEISRTNNRDEEPDVAHLMATANHLCRNFLQFREDVEAHQQAYEQAIEREQWVYRQLVTVVHLIERYMQKSSPEQVAGLPALPHFDSTGQDSEDSEPRRWRRWWYRFRDRFRRKPGEGNTLLHHQHVQNRTELSITTNLSLSPHMTPPDDPSASQTASPPPLPKGIPLAYEPRTPALAIYCLGPFRVYQDDQFLEEWHGLKGQLIFKFLLARKGNPAPKEVLMDLFWRDSDPEAARRNLHQAIYSLRLTLRRAQPDYRHILYENDSYLLNSTIDTWVDFYEFERLIQHGQELQDNGKLDEAMAQYGIAESLYQGEFLSEGRYEEWARPYKEQYKNLYLHVADTLGEYSLQNHDYTAALALTQKVLQQDCCHESAHRRMMRCYMAQGQRQLTIRHYQLFRETLLTELDVEPSEETVTLFKNLTS